ncbi:retrovirus-related pol polyprotein from transposon TNT 1-94 [Tanacetum coccineum]|uniref:Retrovirus-related pol polyprotein from transposon TNT 1-94 n=1 Tax=Tanacetum coccineum TaxID=301880 RepID=A0ABQ5CSH0_9ASTR
MTLIEAARTMLADSFLPNTLWAEAVSTACYVLNTVLVTKPQNKTPYELITGKLPIISYIRPFGCHVTILNTIDHLGKFDGKSDEGFLVGYSLQSKAFRETLDDSLLDSLNEPADLIEKYLCVAWPQDPSLLEQAFTASANSLLLQCSCSGISRLLDAKTGLSFGIVSLEALSEGTGSKPGSCERNVIRLVEADVVTLQNPFITTFTTNSTLQQSSSVLKWTRAILSSPTTICSTIKKDYEILKEQKKRRKVQTVIAKNKQLLVVKAMLRQRAIPGRQMSYPKRKSGVLCVTFSVRYSYHRRRDICHLCQSQGVLKAVDIFDQRGNIGMISMLKSSDSHVSDSKEKCTFGTCCLSYKDGKVRSKCENKGIVPTEMELALEYTQQGASHEVSDTFPIILSFTHCGNKVILRVLRIILVILPEHPSDTKDHLKMEMEMEIPSSSNVKLITECSDTTYTCYEVMKDLIKVSKLPQTLISYSSSQEHKMALNY